MAIATVVPAPIDRFKTVLPRGHAGAAVRSSAYAENSAANSIASDARNSQMASVTLVTPVSGRRSTV